MTKQAEIPEEGGHMSQKESSGTKHSCQCEIRYTAKCSIRGSPSSQSSPLWSTPASKLAMVIKSGSGSIKQYFCPVSQAHGRRNHIKPEACRMRDTHSIASPSVWGNQPCKCTGKAQHTPDCQADVLQLHIQVFKLVMSRHQCQNKIAQAQNAPFHKGNGNCPGVHHPVDAEDLRSIAQVEVGDGVQRVAPPFLRKQVSQRQLGEGSPPQSLVLCHKLGLCPQHAATDERREVRPTVWSGLEIG